MTRKSRHGTWLTCLLALQLPLASAQAAEVEKATNASLLWGPYRPNLYFGVRPRIPKSLMGGLMWTRVEDYQSVQSSEFITMDNCVAYSTRLSFLMHVLRPAANMIRLPAHV
jgi:hypothetical protein